MNQYNTSKAKVLHYCNVLLMQNVSHFDCVWYIFRNGCWLFVVTF